MTSEQGQGTRDRGQEAPIPEVFPVVRTRSYRVVRQQWPGQTATYRIYDGITGSLRGSIVPGHERGSAMDVMFETFERIWEGDHAGL